MRFCLEHIDCEVYTAELCYRTRGTNALIHPARRCHAEAGPPCAM